MRGIYLDYAATTPVDPRVARAVCACLDGNDCFGNPSSAHAWGRRATAAVEAAREAVAAEIGAAADEILFTSGATEANNLALKGVAGFHAERGRHLVTAASEHKAVIDVCRELSFSGFDVTYVRPEPNGRVVPERVAEAMRDDTILVSVMHANNETGVINDIGAIAECARRHGALMHVDAAQTGGKLAIDVEAQGIDLLSLSAHKLYGPKGVGALRVRRRPRVRLQPLLHGGGHERGLRAGTLATHQIVGMGSAFELAASEKSADAAHATDLANRLQSDLATLADWTENGAGVERLPGIRNIRFAGVEAESLVSLLADRLAVSTGSACTTGSTEPSHVLRAMGQDGATAAGAIRVSWGRMTTPEEISQAAMLLVEAVEQLRGIAVDGRGSLGQAG